MCQAIQQQSSSETEGEGGNTADASSEEEGDRVEEDGKGKRKNEKAGSKRKKSYTSKVTERPTVPTVPHVLCIVTEGLRFFFLLLRAHRSVLALWASALETIEQKGIRQVTPGERL